QCIHQLFEQQAERTPDAVAVVFRDRHLTYRELNRRSNQLAHYLGHRGIQPGDLVAVCVERSLEMVVGLLGILKAGAAYVPLDPASPGERLDFLLLDTRRNRPDPSQTANASSPRIGNRLPGRRLAAGCGSR
ncbi:MAG TPA: AMP-binding protein, partial [Candidatus Solibacter sp.]